MKVLAILGASGHGKVLADAALAGDWQQVVFFDDAYPRLQTNSRWPVIGNSAALFGSLASYDGVIVAIGDCAVRWALHLTLRDKRAKLATIVHPRASLSSYAVVGEGSVLFAGAVVNVDSVLGEACIINTGASVDHDCVLAESVHVSPGAHLSGNVIVGARSWVGVGASVRQGVRIGSNVTVGAGAAVVKDVHDGLIVAGCPARPLVRK
jgi:sugar O-acyltransferase (sialic acid O-acetyltransferase NeuD family)